MRKIIRKHLPDHTSVLQNRWLKPFGSLLHHHNLWHLHRRSVAGGVAVGLFCGLIPGPLQMLGAALCAVVLRVNLPVAVMTTLYSNPLTIVPLYAMAYGLGVWVSGVQNGMSADNFYFPEMHWHNWINELVNWLVVLGKPFLLGLPLLAVIFAVAGYAAVRLAWRIAVVVQWRARKRHRQAP